MRSSVRHLVRDRIARVAITAPASSLASRWLPPIDRLLLRLTGGRHTLLGMVSGLLVISLTTTGARTGRKHTALVVAVPDGAGRLIVVASNHGKPNHPGWYHNLLTHPRASITARYKTYEVHTYEAMGKERERLWKMCLGVFPYWQTYDDRTPNRHLPIMVVSELDH